MIMVGDYISKLYGYTIENSVEHYLANVQIQTEVKVN